MTQLTTAQLDELEKNIPLIWHGTDFGINLHDLIYFAREGLKVAGEEALLEQIDVLQGAWGRSMDAIQSICSQPTEAEDWQNIQAIRQGKIKVPEQY